MAIDTSSSAAVSSLYFHRVNVLKYKKTESISNNHLNGLFWSVQSKLCPNASATLKILKSKQEKLSLIISRAFRIYLWQAILV